MVIKLKCDSNHLRKRETQLTKKSTHKKWKFPNQEQDNNNGIAIKGLQKMTRRLTRDKRLWRKSLETKWRETTKLARILNPC